MGSPSFVRKNVGFRRQVEKIGARRFVTADQLGGKRIAETAGTGWADASGEPARLEVVRDDLAFCIQSATHPDRRWRSLRIPRRRIGARVLQTHRTSARMRENDRIDSRVIGIVHPVRSRSGQPRDAHVLGRHLEQACHCLAQRVRLLPADPDGRMIHSHVGNRASGAHARVRLERVFVLDIEFRRSLSESDLDVADLLFVFGRLWYRFPQRPIEIIVRLLEHRFRRRPRCSQLCRGFYRLLFALTDNPEKVSARDDFDQSRQSLIPVIREQARAGLRRPDYPAVHHPGNLEVDQIGIEPGDLERNVMSRDRLADNPIAAGGLGFRLSRHLDVEALAADQFGIGDAAIRCARLAHHAVADAQLIDRDTQPPASHAQQRLPRLGAGRTQCGAAVNDPVG